MTNPIGWCDETWNPVTGCSAVSAACENCYARRMARRLRGRCGYPKDEPFGVTFHPDRLEDPLRWRKARDIFVCSMGDLFHKKVCYDDQIRVFAVMSLAQRHRFFVLTKRGAEMRAFFNWQQDQFGTDELIWFAANGIDQGEKILATPNWPFPNVWLGVTVENQDYVGRMEELLKIPAARHFVSCEPLLGPVEIGQWLRGCRGCPDCLEKRCLPLPVCPELAEARRNEPRCGGRGAARIDWVIAGGETGPGARPADFDWFRSLRDECAAADVPFFFKGMAKIPRAWSATWKQLNGREHRERPKR